jgi:hypothetical protein
MDAPTFIDKVLTPLGAGVGVYLGISFSPMLRQQSKLAKGLVVAAVVIILGGLKWFAIV